MNTMEATVSLNEWLKDRDIDPMRALAISAGTDGLKIDRDNVMSISVSAATWPGADVGTVYLEGANPLAEVKMRGRVTTLQEITGVSPETYYSHAMSVEEAADILRPVIEQASFLVSYSVANFMHKWLMKVIPDIIGDKPILDVIDLAKLAESNQALPGDVRTLQALKHRLEVSTSHIKGGYSFDAVCDRLIPGIDGDTEDAFLVGSTPELERKVYKLLGLWTVLLNRGQQ